MRFLHSLTLLAAAGAVQAASQWGFDDATLSVSEKASAGGFKEKLSEKAPLASTVAFGSADTLKLLLTAKDGSKARRPHQAFLVLREPETGLEAPFPLTVKDNGKATVELKHTDLPVQLVTATSPLQASLVLGSFGASQGLNKPVFDLDIRVDPNAAPVIYDKPLRYGKREEIHHIFRSDPQSPPKVISAFFVLAVLAGLPLLFAGWLYLGANASHFSTALSAAPLAHTVFFGSLVALEGVFCLYYLNWSLFATLPVLGAAGVVAFLSGTKALGEVQDRRLAGKR